MAELEDPGTTRAIRDKEPVLVEEEAVMEAELGGLGWVGGELLSNGDAVGIGGGCCLDV
jgi:hypothetical protein